MCYTTHARPIHLSAKLDGSILGINTKVGSKSELVRCVTQAGYEVEEGGMLIFTIRKGFVAQIAPLETFKNEKLDVSDWAAGPGESEQSEDDDDEDDSDKDDGAESETDDASKSKPAGGGADSDASNTVVSGKVGDIGQPGVTSNIASSKFSGTPTEVYRENKLQSSEESDGEEASSQESS